MWLKMHMHKVQIQERKPPPRLLPAVVSTYDSHRPINSSFLLRERADPPAIAIEKSRSITVNRMAGAQQSSFPGLGPLTLDALLFLPLER